MADHIYKLGLQKTTSAAAGPIVTIVPAALAAGIPMAEVREIVITSVSGVAGEVGTGIPAAAGTGGVTGGTVQRLNQTHATGNTQVATSFATTQPTAPANFYDRDQLQAVVGAGFLWTYAPGEWQLWSGAAIAQVVVWQLSALAVTYDVTVKICE
jgi:hypothetical protein